jgi:hypothetical protein
MSKKKPITIKINKTLIVDPDDIYISKVISSGNGAVINSYKKYINKEVIVIMTNKIKNKDNEVVDATEMAYEFRDKKKDKTKEKKD